VEACRIKGSPEGMVRVVVLVSRVAAVARSPRAIEKEETDD